MPLYAHLDRIERGLFAAGIGPSDPIEPEQLFPLNQSLPRQRATRPTRFMVELERSAAITLGGAVEKRTASVRRSRDRRGG
jgi:hypothetical protein